MTVETNSFSATYTVKPAAHTVTSQFGGDWVDPELAYDGAANDLSTFAEGSASVAGSPWESVSELLLHSIPALPAGVYTSKRLFVNWAITTYYAAGTGASLWIQFSVDSGETWNAFEGGGGTASEVGSGQLTAEIGANTDLSLVRIRSIVSAVGNGYGEATIICGIYDAWVEGQKPGGSGKKAAAITGF